MLKKNPSEELKKSNPDILNCLANLSNDEVFTPPSTVNKLLDLLPKKIWENENIKFLDPTCKSGVFLREIVKRLNKGLEKKITKIETRINHILSKQIYGIANTELTSLVSRRSLYCSKYADSKNSITKIFNTKNGNIFYQKTNHTWFNGSCRYCGANEKSYSRGESLESYAYNFIHDKFPQNIKNMKFDVIIGNPPYQLNDGGGVGSSAIPIYDKFVNQAKKLNPNYLIMIIPSRWFTGGRGLDSFRKEMLNDKRIKELHDFKDARECFPGNPPKGGVCYFLWDKNYDGECEVFSHQKGEIISKSKRLLLDDVSQIFIRDNDSVGILNKVREKKEKSFSELISANDPFGFDLREDNSYTRIKPNYKLKKFSGAIEFYYQGWKSKGLGFIENNKVRKNIDWVNKYKILIPKAWGVGDYLNDWLKPIVVGTNSCCTETYLIIGPFDKKNMADNVITYTQTKFFHYMTSIIKITQNTMQKAYSLVPMQDFSKKWDDQELYKKYNLSKREIEIIEEIKGEK